MKLNIIKNFKMLFGKEDVLSRPTGKILIVLEDSNIWGQQRRMKEAEWSCDKPLWPLRADKEDKDKNKEV